MVDDGAAVNAHLLAPTWKEDSPAPNTTPTPGVGTYQSCLIQCEADDFRSILDTHNAYWDGVRWDGNGVKVGDKKRDSVVRF
jgi:hypothetical protein